MACIPDLDLPYRPTMPEAIRYAAATFGDQDFVVMPDRRVSFQEVEAASRRFAKQLLASGVGKSTRVALQLPTGPEWIIAFTAITRIGAVALPFSTIYQPAELHTALRLGDVDLLVSTPKMVGKNHETYLERAVPGLVRAERASFRFPDLPYLRAIWLEGATSRTWANSFVLHSKAASETIDGFDDCLLGCIEEQVTPADDMFCVFTSGTTAEPKAVLHTHGALLRKLAPGANAGLNAIFGGRVLTLAPFFWIGGLQEVVAGIQSGAAILTLERLDSHAGLELGKREGATSIMGNPDVLRTILGDTDLETAIPTLRPLPRRPWEGEASTTGEQPAGLGMTETLGVWAAVEGFDYRVVDPDTGEVLSDGELGEFEVRGYGLMRGLYKREREEVLSPEGYYRTGDLGYLENGQVYFKGRLKEMIKTKGANVAPAEVERALNAVQHVRMAFVFGISHDLYGEEVIAGLLPEKGHRIDVDSVLVECRRLISGYKVPTTIEILRSNDITYLANGKPDRQAIAALVAARICARRTPS